MRKSTKLSSKKKLWTNATVNARMVCMSTKQRIFDPYAGAHPLERELLESCNATPELYFALLERLSQEGNKVTMQSTADFGQFKIQDAPKLEAGQRPDRSHVVYPLMHSVVDAGAFISATVGLAFAVKYLGFMQAVRWLDILAVALCLFPAGVCIDWMFFGNRSIMSIHTTPKSPEPVVVQAPPTDGEVMEKQAHTLRLEITQANGRLHHIVDVMPDGWDMARMKSACKSIKSNDMTFSQNSAGLSPYSFKKLRELWLKRGVIELQPNFDDRYQLTAVGIELVNEI